MVLDQPAVADRAARHLVDRGHGQLACLVPGGELAGIAQKRFDAVRAVADAAGVPVERVDCQPAVDSVRAVTDHWRDPGNRPSAVYAYNDEFALSLIQVLRDAGLDVPGDISVIGSGNHPLGATLRPRLTSTFHDMSELGTTVASTVRRLLDGQEAQAAQGPAVRPRLTIRESA
ncbi:substrate-binding domain-containing protein [Streptomyces sp. NPDC007983]|uniref:substrate-binding domain-containing protein n=1 Tax=Streptomyces sp. NPDC007983 TaxID=3364800 RepID=UPI0036E323DB